jgi:hypothetical protein
LLHAIDKLDAGVDQGQQLRGIQAPEVALCHLWRIKMYRESFVGPRGYKKRTNDGLSTAVLLAA